MADSVRSGLDERLDLSNRNPFVPETGDGTEDAAGDQAIDGWFTDAERGGGFIHRVGQALDGTRRGFGIHAPTLPQVGALG